MGAPTPTYDALLLYITANAIDVVMVDNASDTFEADEINRAAVRAFIRSLALLVRPRGGAVMLLAHVSKETSRAGRGAGSESYTGSTAWNNSVRSRLFIVSTGTGTYELRTEKAQFAPPRDPIAYTWPRDGLPQLADPTVTVSDKLPATQALLALIHEYAGRPVGLYPSTSPTGRPQVSKLFGNEPTYPKGFKSAEAFSLLEDAVRQRLLIREGYRKDSKSYERFALTPAGREFISFPLSPLSPLTT